MDNFRTNARFQPDCWDSLSHLISLPIKDKVIHNLSIVRQKESGGVQTHYLSLCNVFHCAIVPPNVTSASTTIQHENILRCQLSLSSTSKCNHWLQFLSKTVLSFLEVFEENIIIIKSNCFPSCWHLMITLQSLFLSTNALLRLFFI